MNGLQEACRVVFEGVGLPGIFILKICVALLLIGVVVGALVTWRAFWS